MTFTSSRGEETMFLIQANVIHRGSRPARLTSESTATQTRGEGMEGTMAYLPARWLLIAAAVLALLASPASALTTYYVDPDFGGTQTGATSNPWTSLTTSAWATINGRLASDNVTSTSRPGRRPATPTRPRRSKST